MWLMREIPLTKGYVALVDDEDYERLARHKWSAHLKGRRVYAVSNRKRHGPGSRQVMVLMHREIMRAEKSELIVHRVGVGLDNQKGNLLRGTHQQSTAKQCGPQKRNSTGLRGVQAYRGKFRVRIGFNGKQLCFGTYAERDRAAAMHLLKAQELFGEFARN